MSTFSYFFPALPEVILSIAVLVLILAGVAFKHKGLNLVFLLSKLSLVAALVSLYYVPSLRDITFNGHFLSDSFAVFGKYIVGVCALVVLLNIKDHKAFYKVQNFEFPILLILSVLGMFTLISANDFLTMFIGLELQSLALYVLIGLHHEEKNVTEAVMKYFVLGAIATGFMLFGISFIYGFSGTTNFNVLEQVITTHPPMGYAFLVGLALIICGFAFKVSAVPFHMWAPDVYQGTPYPTMLFLSTAPKITIIAFLMRFLCGPVYNCLEKWQPLLLALSLASMVFGTVATLMQTNIRRFLAYASISSVGFSLVGIALASEDGLRSSLFYTVLYIVALLGFLTCIMILLRRGFQMDDLYDLRGLATEKPFLSLSLAILVLSMSGLPPFPGFLGKLFLLQAVVGAEFYVVAIVMVLSTVVAAYYYLNILRIMFFETAKAPFTPLLSANMTMNYVLVISSIGLLFLLIFLPKILLNWAGLAAATIFYA